MSEDICPPSVNDTDTQFKVLLCLTGSVACIKASELVSKLLTNKISVKTIATEHAKHFLDLTTFPVPVIEDADEWKSWSKRGDPVLHIDLRRWADLLLIAPLGANTMAKICTGICDNLVTCVARAWDLSKPLLFAPAMNTHMWDHPITREQVGRLTGWGYIYIPVVEKTLMCGDKGSGAMAEVDDIVQAVIDQRDSLEHSRQAVIDQRDSSGQSFQEKKRKLDNEEC
ncbi:phosphopantothenoylcysteine decarboxylase-like [Dreissena polymorpha]|uniref:phosphopantothenoylcysteine decarboxylase-like n=1 Tax=Dreissena polymorpha TaxID=45954 RepID=UPI00226437E7|nr:phosphopantothenoylcysteine decarboxylase-like [Dreissena polymorpha]XP_052225209.1 phosphopantothenoylcysteine decarboxylase-like [Dreissena polymorpha]XP_052225210.1 phosphopantothenoylcysteine decarboxylase-like [Dreissena polymorpha]